MNGTKSLAASGTTQAAQLHIVAAFVHGTDIGAFEYFAANATLTVATALPSMEMRAEPRVGPRGAIQATWLPVNP